jgi:hypothetical protein
MKAFWIIGGGRFGRGAAETLQGLTSRADILIVEKSLQQSRTLQEMGFRTECADGIDFLASRLESPSLRVWIVPAAPVHVAYEWVRAKLSAKLRIEPIQMPPQFARRLPNALPGKAGQMFASNADFICPSECVEAGRLCTATGRRRPHTLYAFIRRIYSPSVKILVVRSFQMAPGVGALRPRDLFEALHQIESARTPVLLATACKCHCVLNSFRIITCR